MLHNGRERGLGEGDSTRLWEGKTFIKHTSHDSTVLGDLLGENLKAEDTRIGKYVDITRVWGQPSPANYAAGCSTFNCRR